jgi:hypothetical protein
VNFPVFSLPNLLTPALRKWPTKGPITIVVTEVGSRTGWLSAEFRAEQCRTIRHLLQECLHSDLDVLLPKMGVAGAAELIFIVAVTDEIGGEAISKRIREQFDDSEHFQQAELTLSTSYQSLAAITPKVNESREGFLEKMATNIQELMKNETALRMVENG